MRTWALVVLSTVGWLHIAVRVGRGCSCDRQPVEVAYGNADVVFEAKIVAINGPITTGSWPAGNVRFKVSKTWKGKVPSDFEMPAVVVGGSCLGFYSFLLKPGNELLVYAKAVAWTPNGDKAYFTDACSRTQLRSQAKGDLAFLRTTVENVKP